MKRTLIAIALLVSVGLAGAQTVFTIGLNSTNDTGGFLTGLNERPTPNNSPATGGEVGAGISYDAATRVLDFNAAYGLFGFIPLTGNYTASHLHIGDATIAGPVTIDLAPLHTAAGPNAGFYSGEVTLNETQENALFNNLLYFNIHSTLFGGGEIRAQLIPTTVPEPSTWALAGLGLAAALVLRRRQ